MWQTWVGCRVRKNSGKPFKSGKKINTIKSCEIPFRLESPRGRYFKEEQLIAFYFEEDDSFVECHICELVIDHVLEPGPGTDRTVRELFIELVEDLRRTERKTMMHYSSFSGRHIAELPTAEEIRKMHAPQMEEAFIKMVMRAFQQR